MIPEEQIEELAPAVVIRVALFPQSTLLQLVDAEIVALAAEVGTQSTPSFKEAYDASMQRQRRMLAAATIEDPKYLRALCLTNDDLSRRVIAKGSLPAKRNKQARHLDTTLYRYLARAVWRTEPCDLWAGITLAVWGDETRIVAEPARYAIAPDLRPFQFIVQKLALSPHYVEHGVYKLNPSLKFDAKQQCWRYTVREFSLIISRERASSPGVDALLRALADMNPATLAGIAAELRGAGADTPALDDMLEALHDVGLLVGGLSFPHHFSSTWDALMAVPQRLRTDHTRSWRSYVRRLRRICRYLERNLETISIAELHNALDEVRAIPAALANALDVEPPELPRSVVRCDTKLPYSVVFGPDVKAHLERTIAEYDQFERFYGVDAAARAAHRTLMLTNGGVRPTTRNVGPGAIQTQESAWRAAGADPVLGKRLERWSRWLRGDICGASQNRNAVASGQSNNDEGMTELKLPPIAGLIVSSRPGGYEITGTTTEIAATYGRYGQLWYGLAQRSRRRFSGHPLHEWYEAALASVAHAANVEIVEYVGPCEAMPNGLARPQFPFAKWDRWGTSSPYRADQLHVTLSNRTSVALVHAGGFPHPIALTCFAPVNLGFSEPQLECLLLSSFREIPAWLGPGLPMECELVQERPSPALALPSGNTLKLRRTLLHGDALKEFIAAGHEQRFLLWQELARKYSWPKIVLVAHDGGPLLPVVRDSPIALESALQGLNKGASLLAIEEPGDHTWHDDKDETFASEFIVPFLRRRHAWSELAASESGSSRTPGTHAGGAQ